MFILSQMLVDPAKLRAKRNLRNCGGCGSTLTCNYMVLIFRDLQCKLRKSRSKLSNAHFCIKNITNRYKLNIKPSINSTYQGCNYCWCSQCNASGPQHEGARIATFYCKIFSLKAQVNLLLLNITLHHHDCDVFILIVTYS